MYFMHMQSSWMYLSTSQTFPSSEFYICMYGLNHLCMKFHYVYCTNLKLSFGCFWFSTGVLLIAFKAGKNCFHKVMLCECNAEWDFIDGCSTSLMTVQGPSHLNHNTTRWWLILRMFKTLNAEPRLASSKKKVKKRSNFHDADHIIEGSTMHRTKAGW